MDEKECSTTGGDWEMRRVAIVGAGAMGTTLAAIVGRRLPVVVVCRDAGRAAELFRDGARAQGAVSAESRPIIVGSMGDLAAVGGVSALFVTTKTTAIPQIAAELRPLMDRIGDQAGAPYIVSFQNGIESGRHLMELLRDRRVLRMVLSLGAVLDPRTGAARVHMAAGVQSIGCAHAAHRDVCRKISEALSAAGLRTEFVSDIEARVWAKGIINAAVNPVAALVNSTIGQVMDSPARLIVEALLREGLAVGKAAGIHLADDYLDQARETIRRSAEHTPSMVEDIRAGRESEVGELNRQILAHARQAGVPAPTHEVIDALIETFDWKLYSSPARPPAAGFVRGATPDESPEANAPTG